MICLTILFPKRKRDERKEATYKSAGSEGMPCSREEGATARGRLDSGCPGGNSYKAKMFAKSALGPSRTNKVLFERTLFVAAVRRSLLCLDSPQVKFSAERVASGRPRLRGPQRQKPRKNESAGSWDSRCAGVFCGCIFVLPPRCRFRAFALRGQALRREVPGRLIKFRSCRKGGFCSASPT